MPRGQGRWVGRGLGPGRGFSTAPQHSETPGHHRSKSRKSRSLFPQKDAVDSPGGASREESGTRGSRFKLVPNAEALGSPRPHPGLSGPSLTEEALAWTTSATSLVNS